MNTALALSCLLLPATARVMWVPEDIDTLYRSSLLEERDAPPGQDAEALYTSSLIIERAAPTCGGDASLHPCGGDFPTNFCCLATTTCLALNTTSSVTAAICCPAGQDCATINAVSCDKTKQNATLVPGSQLHSNPPQDLVTCGSGCCPQGYHCQNGQCVAQFSSTAAATPAVTSAMTMTTTTTSPTSSATTTSPTAENGTLPLIGANSSSSGTHFNSKSFAAGFVPGLLLGAFIAALLLLLLFRKRRGSSSYVDEKGRPRDTLTDLGTLPPSRRPTVHGRSISEPAVDMSTGYRTDFLRSTPPRGIAPQGNGYAVDVRSPADPVTPHSNRTPKIKALFSRSPFMNATPSSPPSTQPPVPAHLKRGTLSIRISPVRALKKQKSTHSLRRQMTDASRLTSTSGSRRHHRPDVSRSGSTETIQVLMPSNEPYVTPERGGPQQEVLGQGTYQPPNSAASTWKTSISSSADEGDNTPDERPPTQPQQQQQGPYASSSRYPSSQQPRDYTPTRPPVPRAPAGNALGSPYTPSKTNGNGGGLMPLTAAVVMGEPADTRRDTTFSAMMERAGLRKSELVMGGGGRGR